MRGRGGGGEGEVSAPFIVTASTQQPPAQPPHSCVSALCALVEAAGEVNVADALLLLLLVLAVAQPPTSAVRASTNAAERTYSRPPTVTFPGAASTTQSR